jgi:hypothetical protein
MASQMPHLKDDEDYQQDQYQGRDANEEPKLPSLRRQTHRLLTRPPEVAPQY